MRSTLKKKASGPFLPQPEVISTAAHSSVVQNVSRSHRQTVCLKLGIATVQREFLRLLTSASFVSSRGENTSGSAGSRPMTVLPDSVTAILEIYGPKLNSRRADTGPFCPAFELWLLTPSLWRRNSPKGSDKEVQKRPCGRVPLLRIFTFPGGSPEVLRWLLCLTSAKSRGPT